MEVESSNQNTTMLIKKIPCRTSWRHLTHNGSQWIMILWYIHGVPRYWNFPFYPPQRTMQNLPITTLRPSQDDRHFPDDIFKCISLNEDVWIFIKTSLKCIPNGRINSIPSSPVRHQVIIWTNDGLVYWHIYASLSASISWYVQLYAICQIPYLWIYMIWAKWCAYLICVLPSKNCCSGMYGTVLVHNTAVWWLPCKIGF